MHIIYIKYIYIYMYVYNDKAIVPLAPELWVTGSHVISIQ